MTFLFLIIFSCRTFEIEDEKSYKKINSEKIEYSCFEKKTVFINKKTKKKLEGKYRMKWKYETIYSNFKNGVSNGKYQSSSKLSDKIISTTYTDGLINGLYEEIYTDDTNDDGNIWHIKSHFVKGHKHGTEEEFVNDILNRTCIYKDNLKIGKEYIFDLNNKDTLDIINYSYKRTHKPLFSDFKFVAIDGESVMMDTEIPKYLISAYAYSYFKGTITMKGKYYYTNYLFGHSFFHTSNSICKDDFSYIIKINNVYFLTFESSAGLLYKLKKEP